MADQDPYAATALKAAASKGDPYAATAVASAPPPPNFTTNSINPATGTGYGLYDMQGPNGAIKAPFNRVADALDAGYTLPRGVDTRYRDDLRASRPSWFQQVTERTPMNPNTTPVDDSWAANRDAAWNAAANAMGVGGNILKRGARTVTGGVAFPFHAAGTAIDSFSSDPETSARAEDNLLAMHPGAMLADRGAEFAQDWKQSPVQAGENAAGDALGMWALEKIPGVVKAAWSKIAATPEALARAVTDTGKNPVKQLVAEKQTANERIDAVNGDRLERQRQDQAKADYDHRATLLKLRQRHEQSVRDATEAARTGTAKDRAKYQSKTLAAKQTYERSVRDQTAKYQTDRAEALRANLEAERQYNQKIGETAQQNRAATAAERAKADQAARLQVGGSQLIYGLRQLDKALRDRAGVMFDAVREKVGTASRPGTDLGTKARAALTKIAGSSEVPKPFHDILAKYPEAEPDTIEYQGAQIPKTNRLYDVLKEQGMGTSAPPVTFADLQGYYTETGAELAKGTLSGDVYQATKQLHNNIGDMMQDMANTAGAGKQFWDSRTFYRGFMDTFHEPSGPSASGSPVAQALLAKDPAVAAAKFSGDSGDRGIATLRRYSDSLANLAQDVQRTAQTDVKVPVRKSVVDIKRTAAKPVPAGASLPLPPVLEPTPGPRAANLSLPPVLPEPKTVPVELRPRETISSPDLVAARRAAAEARAGKAQTRGTWVATWPIFQAMRALWGGHIPSIPTMMLESAGTFATTKAVTTMMRYPPMIRFLTEARPADVALIPPDLRGDLPGLVNLAQQQGIKVAPALIAATAGAAANSQSTSMQGVAQ